MPTEAERDELRTGCNWTWTTQKGIDGYTVTSKINGNSIFLPAAGYRDNSNLYHRGFYGHCWSSLRMPNDLGNAYSLSFGSGSVNSSNGSRHIGQSIRPVVLLTYTLTLDNNKTPKGTSIIENIKVTTISNSFTSEKEYVASYNTQPDGSGATYNIGDTITLTEDTTLYAQWKDKPILYIVPEEGKTLTVYCNPGEPIKLEKSYWNKYYNCIGYTTQKDSTEVKYVVGSSIIINEDITLYAVWEDLTNGVEFVDLKLPSGNLWAKNNINGHYAWGEVELKSTYDTTNYKYSLSSWNDLTKYNYSSNYCKNLGGIDYKQSLDLSDDIANIQLKGNWNIPTKEDWEELLTLCDWEYIDKGMKITYKGSTDYIFLPAYGDKIGTENFNKTSGFYWSKNLNKKLSAESFAVLFKDNNFHEIISESRFSGLSIRPVMKLINNIPEQPEEPEVPDFPEEIPETEDEFTAKIGTYNVRYWNGENDSDNQGEIAWPNRRDKVFEFLMDEGIWGVQEVTSAMYSDFINKDGYKYIGYGRDNGLLNEKASGEQIGIFYNTSKYQIINQGRFFYENKTKSAFNRLCVWVKVQNLINGKKFYIFNNHLAHDSEVSRENQLNSLLFKVSEIAKDEKVFILGDFNFTSSTEEYQTITDIYKDSFVLVDEPQGPNITYTGLYSTTDSNQKRVDYIYTNVEYIETYKVDDDNKGLEKYPSDHYPVTITYLT
jgi:endonuclease/exonuclease/phosphatase family metal-dependent hydrolase